MPQFLIFLSFFTLIHITGWSQTEVNSADIIGDQAPVIAYHRQIPAGNMAEKQKKVKKFLDILAGTKEKAQLIRPVGIFAEDTNHLWVTDQENQSIFNFISGVGEITQFKSEKTAGFPSLVNICGLNDHRLLFTDSFTGYIFSFSPGNKNLHVFGDTLKFNRPTGVAFSAPRQEVWIAETGEHRIRVCDLQGKTIRTIGKQGTAEGEFNFPSSVWIDSKGQAYVIDAMNFRVQIFSPEGNFIRMFGSHGDATGYFARPKGVATDSRGNIYVTDALFHNVQVFSNEGKLLTYFGSQGQGKNQFWIPAGIFIDQADNIYIADSYNSRIQVFRLQNSGVK